MSRHVFTTDDGLRFAVGFDKPLRSYFAILMDGKVEDEEREQKLERFRGMGFGANIGETFPYLDTVVLRLEEAEVDIPDDIFEQLLEDGPFEVVRH